MAKAKTEEEQLAVIESALAREAGGALAERKRRRPGYQAPDPIVIPAALSGEQEAVLVHLLAGKTQAEAAKKAGVVPETVSRWMHNNPLFVAELNRRRAEVWDSIADRLRAGASAAADALLEIAGDEGYNADDRIRAAAALLKALGERPGGPADPGLVAGVWAAQRSPRGEDVHLMLTGVPVLRERPEGERA